MSDEPTTGYLEPTEFSRHLDAVFAAAARRDAAEILALRAQVAAQAAIIAEAREAFGELREYASEADEAAILRGDRLFPDGSVITDEHRAWGKLQLPTHKAAPVVTEAMVDRATVAAYSNEMERISRTPGWDREPPGVQLHWRQTVRAILEAAALTRPTVDDDMVEAALSAWWKVKHLEGSGPAMRAALEAALGEAGR